MHNAAASRFAAISTSSLVLALVGAIACGKSSPPAAPAPRSLQSIALEPASVTLAAGAQLHLTVMGAYSDGTKSAVASGVSWTSSNPAVATMSAGAIVGAATAGSTTVTANVGPLSATASIVVVASGGPAVLQSIVVAPSAASLALGADQPFTATGQYSDGTSATLPLVTWSSSNAAVAPVPDGAVGLVHGATQGGPVTITATDPASGLSGSAQLTVAGPMLQSISISPAIASVAVGASVPFTVTGNFSNGSRQLLPADVSWTVSNPAVASIGGGVASGVATGGVTITATSGTLSASASLTVTAPAPVTVASAHVDAAVASGGTSRLQLGGLDPQTDYVVRVSSAVPGLDLASLSMEVDQDVSFTAVVCEAWAGGPPCRAGRPSATGDLFVQVTGPAATAFTLDASPMPVLHAGDPASTGFVTTEAYYKIANLPAAGTVQVTVDGLADPFADLFVYDGAQGPFGSGTLCSTVFAAPLSTKSCSGAVPLSGVVYVSVEGWLTAAGTPYSVVAAAP